VGNTCELVQGEPVCTPNVPGEPAGLFCGGFAGIECAGGASCVDDTTDDCDPDRGGADCGGVCVCAIEALCVEGSVFDSSPEVCACVPSEPELDACATVRCIAGTHCEVTDDDGAICAPDEPTNPCAVVLCLENTTCEVVDGEAACTPIAPEPSGPFCGGIAALECPGEGSCVDDVTDGCDPEQGGADCGGVCECQVLALCVEGFTFDGSPEVCACVPTEPEPNPCATVLCRPDEVCVARGSRARCVPVRPDHDRECRESN
jgi:hypothetical protein